MNTIRKNESEKLAGNDDGQLIYEKPAIEAEEQFKTFVMACGKLPGPQPPDPCYFDPFNS